VYCAIKTDQLRVRWQRAEGHRQSLIYQKRYLLLLIAGFQDGEIQTLAAIARMGAHPSSRVGQRVRSALHRFRVIARVI